MTISAKIIADSLNNASTNSFSHVRLTTLQLCYPRFIHAEFMTHRVFSRNASSSRAIPVAKMIEQVRTNPAMPIHWGKNQAGMQANEELTGNALSFAQYQWRAAACEAASMAEAMQQQGLHKQVVNRILEPFQHIHVIVTATEWDNFFALRDHEAAQPEIRALAIAMKAAMNESIPQLLGVGEWHLPYVTREEQQNGQLCLKTLRQVSAARCARVSYLTHDGEHPDIDKDVALFHRLVGSAPIHASPVEHQATPDVMDSDFKWLTPYMHGNFRGWLQFRKEIEATVSEYCS